MIFKNVSDIFFWNTNVLKIIIIIIKQISDVKKMIQLERKYKQ